MSKLMRYRVVREHYGDKAYITGDIRDAEESEVAHLVPHVLEPVGPAPAEKAETEHPNKAETAPPNKADPKPKSKAKSAD